LQENEMKKIKFNMGEKIKLLINKDLQGLL